MNLTRREFLEVLVAASAAGLATGAWARAPDDWAKMPRGFYDVPTFGNVSLLHYTDCHAQLNPVYFREPNVNIGVGDMQGNPPLLVGDKLLEYFGVKPGTPMAHAITHLDFTEAARKYGRVGGFAHLSTLIRNCGQIARAHCSSTVATPGRDRRPRSGPMRRTWSMPRSCSAST